MEAGIDGDAVGGEDGFQVGEGLFEGVGDVEGVGTVLADHGDEDAGLAHDEGAAEFGFGSEFDFRHVFEADDGGAFSNDDGSEFLRGEHGVIRLDDDALGGGIDEARAAHAGGGFGGIHAKLLAALKAERTP